MKMFDRLGLLIRADVHGVMDQLEERSLLLKQHLRDAEIEVARKRAEVEGMEEESRRLAERLRASEEGLRRLEADVDLALAEGRDELARFTLRRLLPDREASTALRDRVAQLDAARTRLAARLAGQEGELESLRTRVQGKLAALREHDAHGACVTRAVADEEIELELLRRQRSAAAGLEVGR